MDTNIEITLRSKTIQEHLYQTDLEHYLGHLVMMGTITAEEAYNELERPPEAA